MREGFVNVFVKLAGIFFKHKVHSFFPYWHYYDDSKKVNITHVDQNTSSQFFMCEYEEVLLSEEVCGDHRINLVENFLLMRDKDRDPN